MFSSCSIKMVQDNHPQSPRCHDFRNHFLPRASHHVYIHLFSDPQVPLITPLSLIPLSPYVLWFGSRDPLSQSTPPPNGNLDTAIASANASKTTFTSIPFIPNSNMSTSVSLVLRNNLHVKIGGVFVSSMTRFSRCRMIVKIFSPSRLEVNPDRCANRMWCRTGVWEQ